MQFRQELYDHEFTAIWQESLSSEQRRTVDRSVWLGRALNDPILDGMAAERARRQVKSWILQTVVGFCIVLPAAGRLFATDSSIPVMDWSLLLVGTAIFTVALIGVITHRRVAERRPAAADWEGLQRLARDLRDSGATGG